MLLSPVADLLCLFESNCTLLCILCFKISQFSLASKNTILLLGKMVLNCFSERCWFKGHVFGLTVLCFVVFVYHVLLIFE